MSTNSWVCTLTPDIINSMYGSPAVIIPGVDGVFISILNVVSNFQYGGSSFSDGGNLRLYYDGGTKSCINDASGLLSDASLIKQTSSQIACQTGINTMSYDVLTHFNGKGIILTNDIGYFTGGTGSNLTLNIEFTYINVA